MNPPRERPWVLFLDADKFVDDVFCDALAVVLKDTDDASWLNYNNFFLNKPLRHGVPQRKLAFRLGKTL